MSAASAAIAFALSTSTHAAIVTHNGYSLDTETNIVTDGNLEWLQWNMTTGMSINQALSMYSEDGWRLASNVEMAELFNSFAFTPSYWDYVFDSDENTEQLPFIPYDVSEDTATNHFIDLFGYTTTNAGSIYHDPSDPLVQATVLYGLDNDGDGFYNTAWVRDDWVSADNGNLEDAYVGMNNDSAVYTINYTSSTKGIALVRGESVNPVPVPAAIWLFGSGLLGLVGIARRKKSA